MAVGTVVFNVQRAVLRAETGVVPAAAGAAHAPSHALDGSDPVTPASIGAAAVGAPAAAVAEHVGETDPHNVYVKKGDGWGAGPAFVVVGVDGALQPFAGSGTAFSVVNFTDGAVETWTITPWAGGLLDDADAAAGRATLELGELATMDVADLPSAGIAAGAGWDSRPLALTLEAWSTSNDPTLALADGFLSATGNGGYAAAAELPAVVEMRITTPPTDRTLLCIVVDAQDGSARAAIGIGAHPISGYSVYAISMTRGLGSYDGWGGPAGTYASCPLAVRWSRSGHQAWLQLADGSWVALTGLPWWADRAPWGLSFGGAGAPAAVGVGIFRISDGPALISGGATLHAGVDAAEGDPAWPLLAADGTVDRVPVGDTLCILARSRTASELLRLGDAGADVVSADTQEIGRQALGLGASATRAVGTGSGDVAAGDQPAAAVAAHQAALALHPTYVVASGDTVNSTTTPSDATGLSFTPAAGGLYLVEAWIVYETAATTTGLQWCFTDSSGATWSSMSIFVPTSATANAVRVGALGTVAAGTGTGGLVRHVAFGSAVVQAQASPTGPVKVRFQSEVATSAVTIRAGSFLRYTRLL